MLNKLLMVTLMLGCSSLAFGCFTDAGCPKGNICVKTGRISGICLSQATPLYGQTPTIGNTGGQSTGATSGIVYPSSPIVTSPSNGGNPNIGNSQVPAMPRVPLGTTGTTCTLDSNCPQGFTCAKSAGDYRGLCTQSSQ
jgi:hypothetical protein